MFASHYPDDYAQIDASMPGPDIATKIYNYLNNTTDICPNGNQKKLESVFKGYKNCGNASKCACTRADVSNKVKSAHAARTPVQIQASNAKRE